MARRAADNQIDWIAIERQYRLGTKSNVQLGLEFNADHSSIGRRAKAKGWVADKSQEVDAVTNSLLIQNASGNANPNASPTDLEIKVAATVAADVVLGHRKGLARLGNLRLKLLVQLEATTDNPELFAALGELLDSSGPDETGTFRKDKINEIYKKVISFSGRVDDAKKLVEIDEKVRKGEREAFGIDQNKGGEVGFESMLERIGRLAANND